jgi:glycosyltransferase involved in cell wall biosynthesis
MFILLGQFGTNFPTPDYDEIAVVLRGREHIVWVATPNERGDWVVNDGVKDVAKLPKPTRLTGRLWSLPGLKKLARWSTGWDFTLQLRKFIQQHRFDIVHLNRSKLIFFWMVPLGKSNRTCYVLDWRQIGERQYRGFLGRIKRFVAVQYRRIPSRYIYDQACFLHAAGATQVLGKHWSRWATVVPLAVSDGFFADRDETKNDKDHDAAVRFVYIGTLNRVRRLEHIIAAAQKVRALANGGRSFEISFVGPDKTKGKYQQLVEQLDLETVVKIKAPIPYQDVPDALSEYDVALAYVPDYPLDWQYHPTLKVLEYRAFGLPIIATDFQPNRDMVEEGINGLLVANSADDIAEAMQRFINDRQFLENCAENARNMREALLWPDVSEMYEQMYERLLNRQERS